MGFFSKFERRVEDGFDEMGDKFFDAPISPVQIAKKAEKQMRREKMVGAGKNTHQPLYTVLVNPDARTSVWLLPHFGRRNRNVSSRPRPRNWVL